jgi:hypothetical protein
MTMQPWFRRFVFVAALTAVPAVQAVTVWSGIDFEHLAWQLIDLAPGDGIAPAITLGVIDGRASGPGAEGPVALASYRYGARYTTLAPDARYDAEGVEFRVDSTITPHTAAIFTVAAFAGVSALPGERGFALTTLATRGLGSVMSGDGSLVADSEADRSSFVGRLLTVRVDNTGDATSFFDIGRSSIVSLASNGVTPSPAPVPEPETWALLALGVPLVIAAGRRARRQR